MTEAPTVARPPSSGPATRAVRWPAVLAWVLWGLVALAIGGYVWLDVLLRQAGRADLALRAYEAPFPMVVVGTATIGAVVASRRPRHPVGWLLLVLGMFVILDGLTDAYARYGLLVSPGAIPAVAYVRILGDTFVFLPACIGFVLLLTPTGSLPSPRWRWWAWVAVAAPVLSRLAAVVGVPTARYPGTYSVRNPLFVPALEAPARVVAFPAMMVTLLGVVVGGASLVVRFRRARGVERQQLRLVAFAAALFVVAVPVTVVGIQLGSPTVVGTALVGYALVLGLAIGAAVLRYRLYDLDRIVSRTLAYGLLTVLLGLGYTALVLGLGQVLGGDRPRLAVAAATLAVAAVFQPARRRIQNLVDRRFNRRRYDAERTIAAFSGRLRQQTDLDALTAELLAVVDQTMQPTRASLWLRPAIQPSTHQPSIHQTRPR